MCPFQTFLRKITKFVLDLLKCCVPNFFKTNYSSTTKSSLDKCIFLFPNKKKIQQPAVPFYQQILKRIPSKLSRPFPAATILCVFANHLKSVKNVRTPHNWQATPKVGGFWLFSAAIVPSKFPNCNTALHLRFRRWVGCGNNVEVFLK